MIRRAFVQEDGNGRMGAEVRDLFDGLTERGVPVEVFVKKRLERRQLSLAPDALVAGEVPVVLGALKQLGIEPPASNDYPVCLQPLLHRKTWVSTVGRLAEALVEGSGTPVFAKPLDRKKRFTGRVFETPDHLIHLEGASRSTKILCAEVVRWLSEYRVYVVHGEVIGVRHYHGDPAVGIDQNVMEQAVQRMSNSNEATAGYGLDLGILDGGVTALVEWNDGFSLGSYGLDRGLYTELIVARWCELTGCGGAAKATG